MNVLEASIPIALLRELLSLDEATGALTWQPREARHFNTTVSRTAEHAAANWNSRYANTAALACIDQFGHLTGRIFGLLVFAHRVVFALVNGRWPEGEIDHINGDAGDNRPFNLRDVTHRENLRNMKRSRANTSGATGVSFNKRLGKWMAHITVDGNARHLGFYDQKEEAVAARAAASLSVGFHENHGRAL